MTCLQYFVDHRQHTYLAQAVAAFINIRLPCQRQPDPITRMPPAADDNNQANSLSPPSAATSSTTPPTSASSSSNGSYISLRPYIRRLIVTGRDSPSLLQALFGANWAAGIGPILHQERVNYLFTAKSCGWAATKAAYDILPDEHAPLLRPLRQPLEEEIRQAEARWSEWLAMEDWMIGPRAPW